MNRRISQTVDMLTRVFDFGQVNLARFPKDSLAAEVFTSLGEDLKRISEYAASEIESRIAAREQVVSRVAARESLREQMRAISQTALGIDADIAGTGNKFPSPDSRDADKSLIFSGHAFVNTAAPLEEQFIKRHLPSDFLVNLKDAVRKLETAIGGQASHRQALAKASSAFEGVLNDALTQLQRLDALVPNVIRDDPPTMAAWEVARRVVHTRVGKKTIADRASEEKISPSTDISTAPTAASPPA